MTLYTQVAHPSEYQHFACVVPLRTCLKKGILYNGLTMFEVQMMGRATIVAFRSGTLDFPI